MFPVFCMRATWDMFNLFSKWIESVLVTWTVGVPLRAPGSGVHHAPSPAEPPHHLVHRQGLWSDHIPLESRRKPVIKLMCPWIYPDLPSTASCPIPKANYPSPINLINSHQWEATRSDFLTVFMTWGGGGLVLYICGCGVFACPFFLFHRRWGKIYFITAG